MVILALRMSALYMRFNWVVILLCYSVAGHSLGALMYLKTYYLQIAHLSSFIQLLQKVLSVRVMF